MIAGRLRISHLSLTDGGCGTRQARWPCPADARNGRLPLMWIALAPALISAFTVRSMLNAHVLKPSSTSTRERSLHTSVMRRISMSE